MPPRIDVQCVRAHDPRLSLSPPHANASAVRLVVGCHRPSRAAVRQLAASTPALVGSAAVQAVWGTPGELLAYFPPRRSQPNQIRISASAAIAQYQLSVATLTMATATMRRVNAPKTTSRLGMERVRPELTRPSPRSPRRVDRPLEHPPRFRRQEQHRPARRT